MDRWIGKVAVVTGASSGIGAALVKDLVNCGLIVIGLARREAKIEELKSEIRSDCGGQLHSYHCDVTSESSIEAAFTWIEDRFGGVDILINNAGIIRYTMLLDDYNLEDINNIIQTNLIGVISCTKKAFKSMQKRDVPAHIININSVLGHKVPFLAKEIPPNWNIYVGTKHAITATTEVLRQELLHRKNYKIRITSISPGLVATEIMKNIEMPDIYNMLPSLKPEDIAQAVVFVLGTPAHVQVHEMIIKPIGEII